LPLLRNRTEALLEQVAAWIERARSNVASFALATGFAGPVRHPDSPLSLLAKLQQAGWRSLKTGAKLARTAATTPAGWPGATEIS